MQGLSRRSCLRSLIYGAALGSTLSLPIARAEEEYPTLVVILSKDLGIEDISLATLRRIFGGDPTLLNRRRAIPFNYAPGNPLRVHFDRNVLDLEPHEVGRYWINRRIRGRGQPPRVVPSEAMLRGVVRKLPGAIGYLSVDKADDTVTTLSIDGLKPTDADYPLRGTGD